MIRKLGFPFIQAAVVFAVAGSVPVHGQGLIFSLPDDGMGVEYQGTLIQETVRPDLTDSEGRETLTWTRELSIKSVGRENAEYDGENQPCRWIEIKAVTGISGAGGIDPGPVGARVYKVLVPESKISSDASDEDTIPNAMLPIVKGYRRLGEEPVEEINSTGLVVYPTLCLLANYQDPQTIASSDQIESADKRDSYDARRMAGNVIRERLDARSSNKSEYWVTDDVPFGLAGWNVTITREAKPATADREDFSTVSTITCSMRVKDILDSAESELVTP